MSESERQTAVPKPKLRWFQYSLRTLLLLTLLCAIVLKAGVEWQRQRRMEIARKWRKRVSIRNTRTATGWSGINHGRRCRRAPRPWTRPCGRSY